MTSLFLLIANDGRVSWAKRCMALHTLPRLGRANAETRVYLSFRAADTKSTGTHIGTKRDGKTDRQIVTERDTCTGMQRTYHLIEAPQTHTQTSPFLPLGQLNSISTL